MGMNIPRERRVLIAEDDKFAGHLLQSALTAEGLEVLLVQDGVDALNIIDRSTLDILITDIDMPNKDGVTLIREIRDREALEKASQPLPVIAMTGGGEDKLASAVEAGATGVLSKPFDILRLIDCLLEFLQSGTSMEEFRPSEFYNNGFDQ
jgi:CheY-like chemotaxis protein